MEDKFGKTENYRILIRDKKGAYLLHPFKSKTEKKFTIDQCSSIISSKKYFAIINLGKLSLYLTKDCSLFKQFDDLEQVVAVHFDLNDKYLTVILKPATEKNLKIYDLSNNINLIQEFRSQTHPNNCWPQIKFSNDEKNIYFYNKTTLEIYDDKKNLINKYENILGYEDISFNDKHYFVASTFITKNNGKKEYNFALYDYKDLSKPIKTFNTSYTDRVKIKKSLEQKYLLFNAINDNPSNKSYYGQSNIYFFEAETSRFIKINLPEGPIHDFSFTPDGEHFLICAGHLPSAVKLYKKNALYVKDIAKGNFNTIKISPDSRIAALCGFGSLKGDIEFYSLKEGELIGKNNFFCCVNFEWAQDSKYLLGSVLSTRVKVDNEYRIMKYNGEEVVVDKNVGEIYDCLFLYEEDEGKIKYSEFNIEKNNESLENKKKENTGGVKLMSTLGKIDFSNKSKAEPIDDGEIIGLEKKKKKKKQNKQNK